MSVKSLLTIWPLFFGLLLIGLAVGVQGSLLGIRASLEGFDNQLTGLLMSCYFAGFLVGSVWAPRLIRQVGHIRAFGALSALASITILVHAVFITPWIWALMRLFTGFAMSAIYVVAESWLNQAASNENRGQVLGIYMITMMSGICAGQFMLNLADPGEFTLFAVISVMVSLAAIPILMTVLPTPPVEEVEAMGVRKLWHRAPVAVMGIVISQWCASLIFGMGAVYATQLGMSVAEVANFMAAMLAGGMVMQWPLGRVSDHVDRRWVLAFACVCAVIAATMAANYSSASWQLYALAFVFGGFCLSQYSLELSIMNDNLRPREVVPASGTIVLISGVSSITGPITGAAWMEFFGIMSFFYLIALAMAALAIISTYRALFVAAVSDEYKIQSTLQVPAVTVGTVLHVEEEVAA
ncbi:MAG: MFS transporter [Halieaceae bacterium]|jgi:MFS family permease|nr:MFS transporter [Halieaceae bacterium]